MSLKVVQVTPNGLQCDVYIQGDSMSELGSDYAPEWRKLAEQAVAGHLSSPMLRSSEYQAVDPDGKPLGALIDMEALRSARFFRKITYVGGGGVRV